MSRRRRLRREGRQHSSAAAAAGSTGSVDGRPARRRRAERDMGVLDDLLAHHPVADAADHGADTDRQHLAERDRAALERVALHEVLQQPVVELRHRGQRQRGRGPVGQPGAAGAAGAEQVGDRTLAVLADQHGQHQGAAPLAVFGGDAVHLGDGQHEHRGGLEEHHGLAGHRRHGDQRADTGEGGRRPDRRAAGHHRGQVVLLQLRDDLGGCGVRVVRRAAGRRTRGWRAPARARPRLDELGQDPGRGTGVLVGRLDGGQSVGCRTRLGLVTSVIIEPSPGSPVLRLASQQRTAGRRRCPTVSPVTVRDLSGNIGKN